MTAIAAGSSSADRLEADKAGATGQQLLQRTNDAYVVDWVGTIMDAPTKASTYPVWGSPSPCCCNCPGASFPAPTGADYFLERCEERGNDTGAFG